jgi:hypothetical protein
VDKSAVDSHTFAASIPIFLSLPPVAQLLSEVPNTLLNQSLKLLVRAMSTTHPQDCPGSLWISWRFFEARPHFSPDQRQNAGCIIFEHAIGLPFGSST